jgi:hypothetical protein
MSASKKMTPSEAGEAFVRSVAKQAAKGKPRTKAYYQALREVTSAAEYDGAEVADANFNLATIEGMLDCTLDEAYLGSASTAELDDLVKAYFVSAANAFVMRLDNRMKAATHAHRGHKAVNTDTGKRR